MLKYSSRRISMPGILPGMVVGIAISFLLSSSNMSPARRPLNGTPEVPLDVARLSFAEITRLPKSTLSRLCNDAAAAAGSESSPGLSAKQRTASGESAIRDGIRNTRRLLPVAKSLSIEALLELGKRNGLTARNLFAEQQRIKKVEKVVLDGRLGDSAAVQDDRPGEIRIGSGYAETLISDDDAVFLLAHELTHVAARTGGLDGMIENISRTTKSAGDVELGEDQEEDLACDFIGAQALKRFIDLYPTGEAKAERLLRTCGYEGPSERLARAWGDFCSSYNGYTGDAHHLSQSMTVRALADLDPDLKAFIDRSSTTAIN